MGKTRLHPLLAATASSIPVLAKDSEVVTVTTSTGEVKPVTWLYRLPDGATMAPNGEPGITKFLLNGNIILTVINNRADFTE